MAPCMGMLLGLLCEESAACVAGGGERWREAGGGSRRWGGVGRLHIAWLWGRLAYGGGVGLMFGETQVPLGSPVLGTVR